MSTYKTIATAVSAAMFTLAINTTAKADCVAVEMEFNLEPDPRCRVSSRVLLKDRLPDQLFLYELGALPATASCYKLVDPISRELDLTATVTNPANGDTGEITVSGYAGLTLNNYPAPTDPTDTISFTAASILRIDLGDKHVGKIVTRDAGTIYPDGRAAARLAIDSGTTQLRWISGYIDEVGEEFNPLNPATASGILCGNRLSEKLLNGGI